MKDNYSHWTRRSVAVRSKEGVRTCAGQVRGLRSEVIGLGRKELGGEKDLKLEMDDEKRRKKWEKNERRNSEKKNWSGFWETRNKAGEELIDMQWQRKNFLSQTLVRKK